MHIIKRRFIKGLVAAACLSSQLVPGALARPAEIPSQGHHLAFTSAIERLKNLGVPQSVLAQLAEADTTETFTGTITFSEVAGDLDDDGNTDAFITTVDYTFTVEWGGTAVFPSIEEEADSRVSAVSGRSGEVLWRKRWKDFVVPVAARVGKHDRAGALAFSGLMSMAGPFEDRRLLIDALAGRSGKRLWRSKHRSVTVSEYPAWAGHDVPVAVSLFDGVKGRSTDVLLGVAEVASVGVAFTSATQAIVVDGRSGKEERHPSVDAGINWIADPMPASDLDRDGLEDYVVALADSPHLGGGQEPPNLNGVVHARSSSDGGTIWTETGFDLNWLAWAFPLPDVVGGARSDIGLATIKPDKNSQIIGGVYFGEIDWVTYLVDGDGMRRWKRWGSWPYSPGDLDGDHRPDVVTMDYIHNFRKGMVGIKTRAYRGDGKTQWRRSIASSYDKGACQLGCSTGLGSGAWMVGDVDGDRTEETYVRHEVEQAPGEDPTFTDVIDGRSGKRFRAGGEELHAPAVSFGGSGTDLLEVVIEGGSATIRGRDGRSFRMLWETEIALNGLRSGRRSVSVTGGRFDADRCGDVLVSINVDRDAVTAALSGGSGELLWQQAAKRDIRLSEVGTPKDHNTAC
jgi:hypothetical protein